MTGIATMGRKSTQATKPSDDDSDQVRIRVSSLFKLWLHEYAEHRQLTMTDTIVQALIRDAKEEGFQAPPKR